jgi:hypothetical protein
MNALSKYIIDSRKGGGFPTPSLICRDGFKISVQASGIHYCEPRDNDGPWTSFECGFPNRPVPELRDWKEELEEDAPDEDSVFAYVPWAAVMLTIEKHGGCDVLEEMK